MYTSFRDVSLMNRITIRIRTWQSVRNFEQKAFLFPYNFSYFLPLDFFSNPSKVTASAPLCSVVPAELRVVPVHPSLTLRMEGKFLCRHADDELTI